MEDFKKEIKEAVKEAVMQRNKKMLEEGYLMPKILEIYPEAIKMLKTVVLKLIMSIPNDAHTPEEENTDLIKVSCATMESIMDQLREFDRYIDVMNGKEE